MENIIGYLIAFGILVLIGYVIYTIRHTEPIELSEEQLLHGLNQMDKRAPQKRALTRWDIWFAAHTKEFQKSDEALKFINTYGNICDTYLEKLPNAQENIALQKKLISVTQNPYDNQYRARYSNILCNYLRRWDLDPEIKAHVFSDPNLKDIKETYELFRK